MDYFQSSHLPSDLPAVGCSWILVKAHTSFVSTVSLVHTFVSDQTDRFVGAGLTQPVRRWPMVTMIDDRLSELCLRPHRQLPRISLLSALFPNQPP